MPDICATYARRTTAGNSAGCFCTVVSKEACHAAASRNKGEIMNCSAHAINRTTTNNNDDNNNDNNNINNNNNNNNNNNPGCVAAFLPPPTPPPSVPLLTTRTHTQHYARFTNASDHSSFVPWQNTSREGLENQ